MPKSEKVHWSNLPLSKSIWGNLRCCSSWSWSVQWPMPKEVQTAKILARKRKWNWKRTTGPEKNERARLRNSEDPVARSSAKLVFMNCQCKFGYSFRAKGSERRTAYAKKKSDLAELKQRHKAGLTRAVSGSCIRMTNAQFTIFFLGYSHKIFLNKPRLVSFNRKDQ